MNTTPRALSLLLASALAAGASAQDFSNVSRIKDNGQDGDERIYDVRCVDGWQTRLIVRGRADEANRQWCYTTRQGEKACPDGWDVRAVAAVVCG